MHFRKDRSSALAADFGAALSAGLTNARRWEYLLTSHKADANPMPEPSQLSALCEVGDLLWSVASHSLERAFAAVESKSKNVNCSATKQRRFRALPVWQSVCATTVAASSEVKNQNRRTDDTLSRAFNPGAR